MAGDVFEPLQHGAPVFRRERTEHERDLAARFDLAENARIERVRERDGTVGVVSAVEQREVLAVSVQKLVPPGPLRLLDTLSHRFGGEAELPPDGHRYRQV